MKRGDRLIINGVEYAITHIELNSRRGQIDLIPIEEARRRRDELNALLEEEA